MIAIELCTFDSRAAAKSPAAFAAVVVDCVESSWNNGADLVLLPEFSWVGLVPLVEPRTLKRTAEVFWGEVLPALKSLLMRPGKAVVLGTSGMRNGRSCATGRQFWWKIGSCIRTSCT
jgi:predicted amidohydrolase